MMVALPPLIHASTHSMTHSSFRAIRATVALALPLLVGCDASAADNPSGPPTVRSAASSAEPSAARNGVVSPQQQDVIDALKAYETAIVASDTITLKQIWSEVTRSSIRRAVW